MFADLVQIKVLNLNLKCVLNSILNGAQHQWFTACVQGPSCK